MVHEHYLRLRGALRELHQLAFVNPEGKNTKDFVRRLVPLMGYSSLKDAPTVLKDIARRGIRGEDTHEIQNLENYYLSLYRQTHPTISGTTR